MECININRSGKDSADELSKISQWEDGRLSLLCTDQLRSSYLKMNCQHVCKYRFPEAIFNILSCPGTQAQFASVFNATRLFNVMNTHARPSASAGERKNNAYYMSQGCSDDYFARTTCL